MVRFACPQRLTGRIGVRKEQIAVAAQLYRFGLELRRCCALLRQAALVGVRLFHWWWTQGAKDSNRLVEALKVAALVVAFEQERRDRHRFASTEVDSGLPLTIEQFLQSLP